MKRNFLLLLFCFFHIECMSQAMFFGVKSGLGFTTDYTSASTPSFGAEYQISPFRHIYLGGSLFIEGYSFTRNDNTYEQFGGQGYTLTQTSSYLYLSPKVDFTVGHHEYFHFYFTGGYGILTSGEQTVTAKTPDYPSHGFYPGVVYDTGNTSKNINHRVFRISIGATQHVQILPEWDLVFGEEMAFIPTWISTNTFASNGDQSMELRTNYVALSVGLMYKRNWKPLKALRSWGGY